MPAPTSRELIADETTDGSIKQWVNNSAIPAETVLYMAEQWIYQRLRVRDMIQHSVGTLTASTVSNDLPANFRQPLHFMFTPTASIAKSTPAYKTLDELVNAWGYDGDGLRTLSRPQTFAVDGTSVQFESRADQDYPWHWANYGALPELGTNTATTAGAIGTSSTNFLTQKYTHLLYSASASFAYEWLRNEREKGYWLGIAEKEIFEANKETDESLAGVDLVMEIGDGSS